MKVIGTDKLETLKKRGHPAKSRVLSWEQEMREGQWNTPHELKQHYPTVSIIGKGNTVFNIMGNQYRIWVNINYNNSIVLIRKSGTHAEYERWEIV